MTFVSPESTKKDFDIDSLDLNSDLFSLAAIFLHHMYPMSHEFEIGDIPYYKQRGIDVHSHIVELFGIRKPV